WRRQTISFIPVSHAPPVVVGLYLLPPWKEHLVTVKLCLAQEDEADRLLSENPFALLVGMLLDQQVPMETAFSGPKKTADRMRGFDPAAIAHYDPHKFAALSPEHPA